MPACADGYYKCTAMRLTEVCICKDQLSIDHVFWYTHRSLRLWGTAGYVRISLSKIPSVLLLSPSGQKPDIARPDTIQYEAQTGGYYVEMR